MSDGIDYSLKRRLENIQNAEINDFYLFYANVSKLDEILAKINDEIDLGNARKKWCKTCTNTDKGFSDCRMTACMGCAIGSPFDKPLNYLGDNINVFRNTKDELTNLIKSFNEMFEKIQL